MAVKTLISAQALHELLANSKAVVLDCRFSLLDAEIGGQEYAAGHIPGAQYANLNTDLSSPVIKGQTGRHPLPLRDQFIKTVGRFGIENGQTVVAYDANNGAYASRLWWLMRWLGHDNVMVLDGGFDAWIAEGFATTTAVTGLPTSQFKAAESLVQSVSADALLNSAYQITDARDPARFRGEVEPIDPIAGHIPGATCLPFAENMEAGRFKSPAQLRDQFVAAGLSTTEPTICYCGSGVTACQNALALCHAGMPEPILYPGSWSEWIIDSDRPIATGE